MYFLWLLLLKPIFAWWRLLSIIVPCQIMQTSYFISLILYPIPPHFLSSCASLCALLPFSLCEAYYASVSVPSTTALMLCYSISLSGKLLLFGKKSFFLKAIAINKKPDSSFFFFKMCVSLQLSPTDKSLEFDRDFRIRHYAGDVV